ncbi:hypothetical protein JRQ81_012393 [Phrynocephalus forsythii]|uniref:Uncharacterized protein n=1 Tax=Phrynocephalus forsythii TaxID=171643 RepID=A0A9Q1AQG9_9SAUR|nr:hypothetical protein JRQ81_012393 [Phrynocephalus forsythii]
MSAVTAPERSGEWKTNTPVGWPSTESKTGRVGWVPKGHLETNSIPSQDIRYWKKEVHSNFSSEARQLLRRKSDRHPVAAHGNLSYLNCCRRNRKRDTAQPRSVRIQQGHQSSREDDRGA